MRQLLDFEIAEAVPAEHAVLASQGLPERAELSDKLGRIVDEARSLFRKLAEPRALIEELDREEFADLFRQVVAERDGALLSFVYPRAEALALFAATVGEPVCRAIRELFAAHEPALGYQLDAECSVAADRLADLAAARFRRALADRCSAAAQVLPYSPGYCGWPIEGQGPLFARLRPVEIGITLNDSSLMQPLKSVSGVLVAGPLSTHDFNPDFAFCSDCRARECRPRVTAAFATEEVGR